MNISIDIDPTVDFRLKDGRKLTVDALELSDFVYASVQRHMEPALEEDGTPKKDPKSGEPLYNLHPDRVIEDVRAWVKEQTGLDLSRSEATGIRHAAHRAAREKKASWAEPTPALPTSPPDTDPRYSD